MDAPDGIAKVLPFFAAQPRCLVAMEACASSHYWARETGALGHEVRLIAPPCVKPFVKRQKNDAADAEAIAEATSVSKHSTTDKVCTGAARSTCFKPASLAPEHDLRQRVRARAPIP